MMAVRFETAHGDVVFAVSGSQVAPPVLWDHVLGGNTCDKEGGKPEPRSHENYCLMIFPRVTLEWLDRSSHV